MTSLQQMRKHLASIRVCDGLRIQGCTAAAAASAGHTTDVHRLHRCAACNYGLWDGLGKRGVCHLQLKQGDSKLSIIHSLNV